jgi:hypothetical protein
VGAAVGLAVGTGVGAAVGAAVGGIVGEVVGAAAVALGLAEGASSPAPDVPGARGPRASTSAPSAAPTTTMVTGAASRRIEPSTGRAMPGPSRTTGAVGANGPGRSGPRASPWASSHVGQAGCPLPRHRSRWRSSVGRPSTRSRQRCARDGVAECHGPSTETRWGQAPRAAAAGSAGGGAALDSVMR